MYFGNSIQLLLNYDTYRVTERKDILTSFWHRDTSTRICFEVEIMRHFGGGNSSNK